MNWNSFLVLAFGYLTTRSSATLSYCSKHLDDRRPPKLSENSLNLKPELLQVIAILRHGARIPQKSEVCFPMTPTTYQCGPEENEVFSFGNSDLQAFKRFDANPQQNFVLGDCEAGSLLPEGRHQLKTMGSLFREAYLEANDPSAIHSGNPLLVRGNNTVDLKDIYVRATDMQRTRQSALAFSEELLMGMDLTGGDFYIHTIDFPADYIYPNAIVCPVLNEIRVAALATEEYRLTRKANRNLLKKLDELSTVANFERAFPSKFFDCLIGPLCMGYEVPEEISMDSKLLNELWEVMQSLEGFYFRHWDGLFSTISIRGFMNDLRQQITNMVQLHNTGTMVKQQLKTSNPFIANDLPQEMVVYVGHDTTIQPILVNLLGSENPIVYQWPPFVANLSFELFKLASGDFVFRAIYNGEVITNEIPACRRKGDFSEEFCATETLFEIFDTYLQEDPCFQSLDTIFANPSRFLGTKTQLFLTSNKPPYTSFTFRTLVSLGFLCSCGVLLMLSKSLFFKS